MPTRNFALTVGIIFLAAGVLGFVPGITTPHGVTTHTLRIETAYGYLLGLFPVNVVHNLVHIGIGLWGLFAYRSTALARAFARSVAWIYGIMAVMGIFPALSSFFGLMPLWGHDIWLHALTAAVAAYFGYVRNDLLEPDRTARPRTPAQTPV